MKLPAIDSKKKWIAVGVWYACFCVLYTLTGRVHLREPARLEPSAIDQSIPFIDWTVFVYLSQFVFLALCIGALKKTGTISRTLYGLALASILSFIVFMVYPTSLPRPPVTGGVAAIAYEALYLMDADTNCFPSLHVALAGLGALGVMDENRKHGAAALIWAALIALSTITTRQHYFVDVIGGLAVIVFCRVLLRYLIRE
jgi:membrane-associated phospholipid phosphatase